MQKMHLAQHTERRRSLVNVTLCPPQGTLINGVRRQLGVSRIAQEQLEGIKEEGENWLRQAVF